MNGGQGGGHGGGRGSYNDEAPVAPKIKPDLVPSGKLQDSGTALVTGEGGLAQKYSEPVDACLPDKRWMLYPFSVDSKKQELAGKRLALHRESYYMVGKDKKLASLQLLHPTISKQHAVIQYRRRMLKNEANLVISPYLIDLESTNGTLLNGKRIESAKYYQLKERDRIRFAMSSKEYVLMNEEMVGDVEG
jgi:smad nuclear-interacting protein 1